jgi:hypothetical protein
MTHKGLQYFLLIFCFQISFAQSNVLWQGYFSYNEIKDLSQSTTDVFAASENALFSKSMITGEIKTTNTIDGLSGQTISALYYSPIANKTIVGYENGLLIVKNEKDGSIQTIVSISNKKLPASMKRINHFMEHQGSIYISCDFGIVQFNLAKMIFGDTYFIGTNGSETSVKQTAIFDGFIYAATIDGLRKADSTNKNLIDFKQWSLVNSGNWSSVEAFDSALLAINATGNIHKYNSSRNSFISYLQLGGIALDMRASSNFLLVTPPTTVHIFDKLINEVKQIKSTVLKLTTINFSCATAIGNTIFIGTKENGMYTTTISSSSELQNMMPSGPSRNNIFALNTTSNSLWAVYGDYSLFYDPYPLDRYGISKFSEKGWLNIPYENLFEAKSLVKVITNPTNENEVYASSFFSGLLKIVDDAPKVLLNQTNSALESLTFVGPTYIDIRINGTAFDKAGNLWVTNSLIKNGLKVLSTSGQWQSYAMDKILTNTEKVSFNNISIDKNGTKWITTSEDGLVAFNEKNNIFKKISIGTDTGNLPTLDVRIAAVDNNDQLWIGTTKGLRILSNTGSYMTDNTMTTKPIIILEDNLPQELLFEQFITDIVVDGANNKWIGTADSGVFLVSPNGQETKYHFTETNSPLPSNIINDIAINSKTGEVFFATNRGMVSFKGTATTAKEDLNSVFVYPNPVRPGYEGTVKIAGLVNKAVVKITDIEGNLVHETTAEGGTIEWDTTAFGRHKVASGVYMIFIIAQDGIETKTKKVMIIR